MVPLRRERYILPPLVSEGGSLCQGGSPKIGVFPHSLPSRRGEKYPGRCGEFPHNSLTGLLCLARAQH